MPGHAGKRPHEMTTKKWGGGRTGNQRRDDRRGPMHNRNLGGGARPVVSPWENGVTPGMASNIFTQNTFSQPVANSYLLNAGMNRQGSFGTPTFSGFGNNAAKMRRLDRMGFDDQRGRGLLPSPSNTPLLGVAPPAFPPPGRGPEFLQQRMGNPWDSSIRSGGPRGIGMNSGYYPSNRGRQDNSRKFLKARRPLNKAPNSKGAGPKEGKGKAKGSGGPKSPSARGEGDKERASSHSKELKSKQGEVSPSKSERSTDGKNEEDESDGEKAEGKDAEMKEGEEKEEGKEEGKQEKQQEEPFPVKSLYCHICDLDSFSSKKGYIRHLQGITHAKMAELFHAKNAATLELLNISAKLAEMRQRDKVLRRTGKKGQPVMKTTEQMLVQKWLKVGSCCGTRYKSPFGMEEHKLSINHLKAKYVQKQKQVEDKQKEGEGEVKKEEDESAEKETAEEAIPLDEVVRLAAELEKAQKESEENPMTMQTLPIYNPSIMIGLEYIRKELRFRCSVCKGQMFKSLENHCQAHSHYDNIATYLNKIEDAKREEQRKEEEAKKAKEEEEKKAKEAELKKEKEKEEKAAKAAQEESADLPADYIMVDCSEDNPKEKRSVEEEMDEDMMPLGEEEERILNEKEDADAPEEEEEEEEEETMEDGDDDLPKEIFEEVGEKIDFDEDLKKQLENGDEEKETAQEEEEEEEDEEEAEEVQAPPPKRAAYTPRRRGRGRVSRGRSK